MRLRMSPQKNVWPFVVLLAVYSMLQFISVLIWQVDSVIYNHQSTAHRCHTPWRQQNTPRSKETFKCINHDSTNCVWGFARSFSSKKNPDSHTVCVIMSRPQGNWKQHGLFGQSSLLGCKKIQCVVTSTLEAETVSLSSVLDQLSWIRLCWAWLMDSNVRWQNPESALRSLPQSFSTATIKAQRLPEDTVATDCKSLFDLVTRTAGPACSEFRAQLSARKIRDLLADGDPVEMGSQWCPTSWQPAQNNGYTFLAWDAASRQILLEWWVGNLKGQIGCSNPPQVATFKLSWEYELETITLAIFLKFCECDLYTMARWFLMSFLLHEVPRWWTMFFLKQ